MSSFIKKPPMSINHSLEAEVRKILDSKRERYLEALREIKDFFQRYWRSAEGRRVLYRVTSRADYQGEGQELKLPKSIVEKIQAKGKKDPTYSIDDMNDIVGVRLICSYPSDVDTVLNYILKRHKELVIHDKPEYVRKPSGYRAVHLVVSSSNRVLAPFRCEVQIVTMLEEAWSVKSHDLVYKGEVVEKAYERLTRYASELLSAIDKESELLKSEIEAKRRLDNLRREAVATQHLASAIADVPMPTEDVIGQFQGRPDIFDHMDSAQALTKLKQAVLQNSANVGEHADLFVELLRKYSEHYDVDFAMARDVTRLFALVALEEQSGKYKDEIVDFAEKTIRAATTTTDQISARLLKGYILFSVGQLKEALKETECAVTDALNPEDIAKTKNNWAYFAAHYIYKQKRLTRPEVTKGEIRDMRAKALKFARDSVQFAQNEQKKFQYRDTLGFVMGILGSTKKQVEKGIEICKESAERLKSAERWTAAAAARYGDYHMGLLLDRLCTFYREGA